MLDRIRSYMAKGQDYLKNRFALGAQNASINSFCSISLVAHQVYITYAKKISDQWEIILCEYHSFATDQELLSILSAFVKDNQIKNSLCCLVLSSEDYQLLVTDALPVNANEFQSAIRWKIKNLLRYPLQNVIIDSFYLPKMKTNLNKIMVVAAEASKLQTVSELIETAGLKLQIIDISDLALRNIGTLFEEEALAFVYIQENSIQLMIFYQKRIYVSRFLKFGLGHAEEMILAGIERLSTEIQRSFDYYLSLWDHPSPSKLFYSSVTAISSDAIEYLSQKIRIPVELINLNKIIKINPALSNEEQAKFLLSIGGFFDFQNSYPQTINLYSFIQKKSTFSLNPRTVLGSYGAFVLLLLGFYAISVWQKHDLLMQMNQLTKTMAEDQQELTSLLQQYPYSNPIELKKNIDDLQKIYESKAQIIDLLSPNANFSSYLLGLASTIVPGIWLNEIIFSRDENKIVLKGYALEPSLLEKFYNQLTALPIFSKMNFEVNEVKQTNYPANFYITGKKR